MFFRKIVLIEITIFFLHFLVSCKSGEQKDRIVYPVSVSKDVIQLADSIALDISKNGPAAWLYYFENSPDFYMASNGSLIFPDYATALRYIHDSLIHTIPHITLKWTGIRVDSISPDHAFIASGFQEDITGANGTVNSIRGFFTAVARSTPFGWKLSGVHWSIKSPSDP